MFLNQPAINEAVREKYTNPIFYEATVGSSAKNDHEWLKKLDFLSYSYYPPACGSNMPLQSGGAMDANYMEVCYRTFLDMPERMGLFWWKWDETQNRPHYKDDPNGDKGFSVRNKLQNR